MFIDNIPLINILNIIAYLNGELQYLLLKKLRRQRQYSKGGRRGARPQAGRSPPQYAAGLLLQPLCGEKARGASLWNIASACAVFIYAAVFLIRV